jgi:phage terminase small subunit
LGVSDLSEQQERFCRFIVEGKNQRDAYNAAGYKSGSDAAADANASRLISNDKIAARIAEMRANAAKRSELTAAHFAKRLERIAAAAERTVFKAALPGAAASEDMTEGAEVLALNAKDAADVARQHSMDAAKLLGLVIEKRENTNRDVNDSSELSREELLNIARAGRAGASAPADGNGKPDRVHKVH